MIHMVSMPTSLSMERGYGSCCYYGVLWLPSYLDAGDTHMLYILSLKLHVSIRGEVGQYHLNRILQSAGRCGPSWLRTWRGHEQSLSILYTNI